MPEEAQGQVQDQGIEAPAANPLYPTGRLHSTIKDDVSSSDTFTQDSQPAGAKAGTEPGTANNIQGESGKDKGGEGDKGTPGTKDQQSKPDTEDFSEERFDKNPMFQRLNKALRKVEERAIAAEAKAEALLKMRSGKEDGQGEPESDFQNVLDMEDGDIRDKFDTDPKGFLANFARQVAAEVRESLEGKAKTETFQQSQRQTLETYANDNSDFIDMWESGEIPDYMRKHPGHTAISAHMALTEPKRVQAKIDDAVRKAREEERRNAGARIKGSTLMPTSSSTLRESRAEDAILKDTSKVGGRTNAIMQYLRAHRGR